LPARVAVNNRKQGKNKRCSSFAVTLSFLILLLFSSMNWIGKNAYKNNSNKEKNLTYINGIMSSLEENLPGYIE
jgi:hypothetical protein